MTSARAELDALCRRIDVRKQLDGDAPDAASTVEQLLAQAETPDDDGFGLKCVNSALKALDLRADIPGASEMRVRAIELLDQALARRGA
jgi:hypothetical protein